MAENTLDVFKIIKKNIEKVIKASEYTVKSCGTKNEALSISLDEETGFWKNSTLVTSKPPRWIIHFKKVGDETTADFASNKNGEYLTGSKTIGYINNREGNCIAIIIRIISAINNIDNYVFPNWEWIATLIFEKPLPAGTSGETISNLDLVNGEITYAKNEYKISLIGIYKTPTNNTNCLLNDVEITYDEATTALRKFLNTSSEERL